MEKATFVSASYEKSSSITHQGNRSSIQRYLNNGYYVIEERNGFWILGKPATIMVSLRNSVGKIHIFNMKEDILGYYNKQRLSSTLFNSFINDAVTGKINFYMEDGSYCIK